MSFFSFFCVFVDDLIIYMNTELTTSSITRCSATGHKDDTCTKEHKCVNCEENHASYNKKCSFYKREYDIQHIRVSQNVSFFEARAIYQKTHGQRVMNYAGTTKAPAQCTSVCTQTDVSWVGPQPVTRKQRPAASVTIRPVPSVSRSVSRHYHSCGGCEKKCGPS